MKFIVLFLSICAFTVAHAGLVRIAELSAFDSGGKPLPDGHNAPDLSKAAIQELAQMSSVTSGGYLSGLVSIEKKLASGSSMCPDEVSVWEGVQREMNGFRGSDYCIEFEANEKKPALCCYVKALGSNSRFCAFDKDVKEMVPKAKEGKSSCLVEDIKLRTTMHAEIGVNIRSDICVTEDSESFTLCDFLVSRNIFKVLLILF